MPKIELGSSNPDKINQNVLERDLLRFRYLITRGAAHRLGLRDLASIAQNREAFIAECHAIFKKAQKLLIADLLAIEQHVAALLKNRPQDGAAINKYRHWHHVLELFYDSFIWIASGYDRASVTKVYKGPKYGDLANQNVESVLRAAEQYNEDPYKFAIPLDFSRFSCVCDIILLDMGRDKNKASFIEVKEGKVNAAFLDARQSNEERRWLEYFKQYGEKGIKQAERCFRQEKVLQEQTRTFRGAPGIYRENSTVRILWQPTVNYEYFTAQIEQLIGRARKGQYAVEIIDDCLAVAALDTSSHERFVRAEFDARLLVHEAFIEAGAADRLSTGKFVQELRNLQFTGWLEGLGSVFLVPPALRVLGSRSLLDLLFGRIRLMLYLDASRFLALCRAGGVEAGFVSQRRTNHLKSSGHFRDYPIFNGRALGYISGDYSMLMGSARIHEMVFNWARPSSVARELTEIVTAMKEIDRDQLGAKQKHIFTKADFELS